jgi:hypothetical protein
LEYPAEAYQIDPEHCCSSAQVLDWIMQIAGKPWATDACLAGLVRALDDILRPQDTLCSWGDDTELTVAQVRERFNAAGYQAMAARPLPLSRGGRHQGSGFPREPIPQGPTSPIRRRAAYP